MPNRPRLSSLTAFAALITALASTALGSVALAQNWQQGLGSLQLTGQLACNSQDRVEIKLLSEVLLEVKGHNACRSSQVISYRLNQIDYKSATDTFGNFHFFVSLASSDNHLEMKSLAGDYRTLFDSGLANSENQPESKLLLQPASLLLPTSDEASKVKADISSSTDEKTFTVIESQQREDVKSVASAFSVANTADGLQPLPFADPPLSLDEPVEKSRLLVDPVETDPLHLEQPQRSNEGSKPTSDQEELISSPSAVPETELINETDVEPIKSDFLKPEITTLTEQVVKVQEPKFIPADEEIKIELVWTAPVNLNLHIFEPGFRGEFSATTKSPFHVYEQSDPNQLMTIKPADERSDKRQQSEVYRRSVRDLKKGALKLALGYRDRSLGLPETCGTGKFAAIPALAKIKTPNFSRSELVLVNPVSCNSVEENATLLIDIAEIKLN